MTVATSTSRQCVLYDPGHHHPVRELPRQVALRPEDSTTTSHQLCRHQLPWPTTCPLWPRPSLARPMPVCGLCETILRLHCTGLCESTLGLCQSLATRLQVRLWWVYMSLWHYHSIISTLSLLFSGSWRPIHAVRTICDAREPHGRLKMFLGLLWSHKQFLGLVKKFSVFW